MHALGIHNRRTGRRKPSRELRKLGFGNHPASVSPAFQPSESVRSHARDDRNGRVASVRDAYRLAPACGPIPSVGVGPGFGESRARSGSLAIATTRVRAVRPAALSDFVQLGSDTNAGAVAFEPGPADVRGVVAGLTVTR
jgi:hypothetical protein